MFDMKQIFVVSESRCIILNNEMDAKMSNNKLRRGRRSRFINSRRSEALIYLVDVFYICFDH